MKSIETSVDLLCEYLRIIEFCFDGILCSILGNENSKAGHVICSRGPHFAHVPGVPHPVQARSQKFWQGRANNNNRVSTSKDLITLLFKASSMKHAFVWRFLSWKIVFRHKAANKKSTFIKLTSFRSLFLARFQTSDESRHLFVNFLRKRLWKSWCSKCSICSMFFAVIALEQEVIVAVIIFALVIFTHFWCAPTHVQSKASSDFAEDTDFYKTWAHIRCGSCCRPILERLIGVCSC